MTLYRGANGGLLRSTGSGLAGNENCCCGEPADCCCDCDLSGASITALEITDDDGTIYSLNGGPYSLAKNPGAPCVWTIGYITDGGSSGSVSLSYCEGGVLGWRLQGINSPTDLISDNTPGPCSGDVPVTKAGASGFITITGGVPCPT